jgi:nucleotide-binding universal stress UspA family protein
MFETRPASGPIVVGIDGSAEAYAAARVAAWEAGLHARPLLLVHGYANSIPQLTFGWTARTPQSVEAAVTGARTMLDSAASRLAAEHPTLSIQTTMRATSGAAAILDHADLASLVVVGARGGGGFTGLGLGSVAAQVATHAKRPVVVVRSRVPEGRLAPNGMVALRPVDVPTTDPVVVGVDGSEHSEEALAFAFEEAYDRRVDLVTLFAWWSLPHANLGPVSPLDGDLSEAPQEAARMLAEATAGWSRKFPDVTVVRRAVHDLNPTAALIDASRTAGLVVVGCRGRGGFASLLLGSVSAGLIGHAHCPVTVVHTHPS